MKKMIVAYIGILAGIFIASKVLILVGFVDYKALLLFALILLLVDKIIKPFVNAICLPVNIMTIGLFSLVINTLMIYLANWFYNGISLTGFWATFAAALTISVCRTVAKILFSC